MSVLVLRVRTTRGIDGFHSWDLNQSVFGLERHIHHIWHLKTAVTYNHGFTTTSYFRSHRNLVPTLYE